MIKSLLTRTVAGLFAMTALLFFIISCSQSSNEQYTGDLREIKSREKIRVIVRPDPIAFLPRNAEPVMLDRDMAEDIARELELNLDLVVVKDYAQMIERLLQGEGDLIAASMTVTDARKARVAFSIPYVYVDELLITKTRDTMPKTLKDLAGRQICVRRSSSYFETVSALKKDIPSLDITIMQETLNTEDIIDRVARGECFSTVADSHYWSSVSLYFDNLSASLVLARARPIALAMRQGSKRLKRKVNEFIISRALMDHRQETYIDDLDALKSRKVLRMITRNNAMTYFIYRGTQVGFEYELMKRFTDLHNMRLEIVIPPSHTDLIPWLNEGKGDVIAAAMTITKEREKYARFTVPYNYVEEVVVVRDDNNDISRLTDLNGKTVHVRKSSSFYRTLTDLKRKVKGIEISFVPDDIETEEILAGVEDGTWDITVCDSNLLEVEKSYGRKLRSVLSLKKTQLGWAVRKNNKKLFDELNRYIKKEYKGLFYNTIKQKYFEDEKIIHTSHDEFRSDVSGKISPYDHLAKKYSTMFNLDWRLIVSQMYQESKFDPSRKSWAGAVGLMQIMPRTAKELGIGDVRNPVAAIYGGTKYMMQLIERLDTALPLKERIRFALAAYNAGYSHLSDARRLSVRMGWSPDSWFGNVEKALLLLEKPKYYKRARFGYCRGSESVRYVRDIQSRYNAYVEHIPE